MFGRRELSLLPVGAVLVNTARGGVLDGAAVADLVTSGRLAGAAVDVVEGETRPRTESRAIRSFWQARSTDRILVTPHIGGATLESMEKTEVFMASKLATFLELGLY